MTKGANGLIYQAGLRVGSRRDVSHTPGGVYRAIVINTYATDDDGNPTDFQVFCDVILLRSQLPLARVPLSVPAGTVNACVWLPKATTATISGQPLRMRVFDNRGRYEGDATPYEDMNGDVVLVQYADDSLEFPIITGKCTHQRTKRAVIAGEGWSDGTQDSQRGKPEKLEAYVRHQGAELRINAGGDVLLDTVGATEDELEEIPSSDRGEVRIRLKRGRSLTVVAGSVGGAGDAGGADLIVVQQDALGVITVRFGDSGIVLTKPPVGPAQLGFLGASQPFVKGSAQLTALTTLLTALGVFAGTCTTAPVTAPAATLNTAITAAITQLAAALSLTIRGE